MNFWVRKPLICITPVSYTHLDVYKRQSVECEKIHDICQAVYGMKHPSNELEGLYLAREDEQICLLYYQVFVGMLEINITSAEVLYNQKEETINE